MKEPNYNFYILKNFFTLIIWAFIFNIGNAQIAPNAINDQFFNLRTTSVYNLLNNPYSAPDNDPGGLTLVILPEETDKKTENGSAVKVISASTIEFIPNEKHAGWDTFKYVVSNTANLKDTAKVFIFMISGIRTDTAVFTEGNTVNINIIDNDALTNRSSFFLKEAPALKHGEIVLENKIVKYTAKEDFIGQEEFFYTVCDTFDFSQPPICKDGKAYIIRQEILLKIPAGLSPNGDLINDNLVINAIGNFPKSSMKIYNRLGDEVWYSIDGYKNDFIGQNNRGEDLPNGTYYYILELNKTGYFKKYASSLTIQR